MRGRIVIIALLWQLGAFVLGADLSRTLSLTQPRLQGEDVQELQQGLLNLGFAGIGIADAWYGPKTEAAVRSLQRFLGFRQDGIVDQKLWRTLFAPEGQMGIFLADLKSANSLAFDRLTWTEKDLPGLSTEGASMKTFVDRLEKKYLELDIYGELGKVHNSVYLFEDRILLLKKSYRYPEPFAIEQATIEEGTYYFIGKTLYQLREGHLTEGGDEGETFEALQALWAR